MLKVINDNGCTVELLVKNPLQQGLFVPNAVSPSHSDYEVSHFLPKGIGLKEYHVQIYDDWGNLIWESTKLDELGRPVEGWDGTYRGEPVQQDAYVWKISATFLDESIWEGKEYPKGKIKKSGTVTVIR
ncbi:MAG: gliding motility-associated C-terminal domain-containing protein [Crocinitomicaceae bacterium]